MAKKNRSGNSSVAVVEESYEGSLPEVEEIVESTDVVETANAVDTVEEIEEATATEGISDLETDTEPEETTTDDTSEAISENGQLVERFYGTVADARKHRGQVVPWGRLVHDPEFNIRNASRAYSDTNLLILDKQLEEDGQQERMVASLQSDNKLLVVRGNRRYRCMAKQRLADLKLVEEGKLQPENVRWSYVLCDVRKGLDPSQETVLMLDHGSRVGLESDELFEAVVRLRRMGWGEAQIRRKLGFRDNQRGVVAPHYKIASLPNQDVQEEYRKYLRKDTGAKVKFVPETITKLFAAAKKDKDAKQTAQGGGPEFKAAWNKAVEESRDPSKKEPPLKSRIEGLMVACENRHPLIYNVFKYLAEGPNGLPSIDDILSNISRACNVTFPVESEPEVTVTEGNVTRTLD